ncbi:glutamate dehydrogenase [Bizionia arctica]|uniref:Glutamate dehydrogenase n=1 Tax=Bizionia arctica TaxID=1495645 RepID=A0A917GCJ5_9FLAO|nr:glutamate dehydrogenase [Bizionia arctica]GGG38217.1 glutamate dehydrogenase [Bizionia arctica]
MNKGFSQFNFTNEIGAVVGPVAFHSDFGERKDSETNMGNTGFGIGILHYMNFTYLRTYSYGWFPNFFNQHFKVRNELSYNKTNLNNFGKWVDPSRTGENAERLRQHSGSSQNFNIGSQLEYYPLSIRAFEAMDFPLAPYIGLGIQYTFYTTTVETGYGNGNINDSDNFYQPWVNATNPNFNEDSFLFDGNSSTFTLIGSIGTRYKLTKLSDLVFDMKFEYFFDDFVDGLNHNLPSNKTNDWLVWFNVGYIHYLDNN